MSDALVASCVAGHIVRGSISLNDRNAAFICSNAGKRARGPRCAGRDVARGASDRFGILERPFHCAVRRYQRVIIISLSRLVRVVHFLKMPCAFKHLSKTEEQRLKQEFSRSAELLNFNRQLSLHEL